jgi:hypothetical protein
MHDDYVASLANWIAILSISTRLMFEKVRERAIKEITKRLDQVEAFELIGIAIKFDVEQWLKPAYLRIVIRANLITHAEAAKVPLPMAVMLMRSREEYWSYNGNGFESELSPDKIIDSEIRLMVPESTKGTRSRVRRKPMAGTAARGSRGVEDT